MAEGTLDRSVETLGIPVGTPRIYSFPLSPSLLPHLLPLPFHLSLSLKVPAANPSPPPPQFAPEKWSSLLSTGGVILWSLNDIIAKIFPACSFPIASKIPPAFQACVLQAPPRHRGYVSLGHSCKRLPWRDSWHLRCWSLDPQPPPSSL